MPDRQACVESLITFLRPRVGSFTSVARPVPDSIDRADCLHQVADAVFLDPVPGDAALLETRADDRSVGVAEKFGGVGDTEPGVDEDWYAASGDGLVDLGKTGSVGRLAGDRSRDAQGVGHRREDDGAGDVGEWPRCEWGGELSVDVEKEAASFGADLAPVTKRIARRAYPKPKIAGEGAGEDLAGEGGSGRGGDGERRPGVPEDVDPERHGELAAQGGDDVGHGRDR